MSKSKAYFILGDIACKGDCKQAMGLRKPTAHMRVIGDEGIAKPPHTSVLALNPKQREQAVQQLYS